MNVRDIGWVGVLMCLAVAGMAQDPSPAPGPMPQAFSNEQVLGLATQRVAAVSGPTTYDLSRPLLLPPSKRLSTRLVGFVFPGKEPNADGHLQLDCMVEIDAATGEVGDLLKFPDMHGRVWGVFIDKQGRVHGFRMDEWPIGSRTGTSNPATR